VGYGVLTMNKWGAVLMGFLMGVLLTIGVLAILVWRPQ
jgi:hypothetical protein